MSVSVKLEACKCTTKQIELSLIKHQPSGSCKLWGGSSDGTRSLNLQGVTASADETYQIALAVYCSDGTSGQNGTPPLGSAECCSDLAACAEGTCRKSSSWCEQCKSAAQLCENVYPNLPTNIQKLVSSCTDTADLPDCCRALGTCMQMAWTSCETSTQCGSCAEAKTACQKFDSEFNPEVMTSDTLLSLMLKACAKEDPCCTQSVRCIQTSLTTCQNDESCVHCQQASTSCKGLTAAPTPDSARGLYKEQCSEELPLPNLDCVACYAVEPLEIVAGETTLVGQTSASCAPPAITQLKELPNCAAQ